MTTSQIPVPPEFADYVYPLETNLNESALLATADSIEREGNDRFDMDLWFSNGATNFQQGICGTTACIAGHALFVHGMIDPKLDTGREAHIKINAARVLGLNCQDASELFLPTSVFWYRVLVIKGALPAVGNNDSPETRSKMAECITAEIAAWALRALASGKLTLKGRLA